MRCTRRRTRGGVGYLLLVVAGSALGSGGIATGCGSVARDPPPRRGVPRRLVTACRWARSHTERVNVSTGGSEADGSTARGSVSASGWFVVFASKADNLARRDRNGVEDVFVRNRHTGRTLRVSVSSSGREGDGDSHFPSIDADGHRVAFRSVAANLVRRDRNGLEDAFVHDLRSGSTERVSVGVAGEEPNGPTLAASISGNSRVVAFTSSASNLVRRDTNGQLDVFVRDLVRLRTTRVSVGPGNREADGPSDALSISRDGRVVAFRSFATNLVRGDTNGMPDIFVRDIKRRSTRRVNISSSGSQANAETFRGMVSSDGRFVGFRSRASNLVPGDTNDALDVFVRDRARRQTVRVSVATDGAQADAGAFTRYVGDNLFMSRPFLSGDGRFVAFSSRAANLVPGDTNRFPDVFVHDLESRHTVRLNVADDGAQANSGSFVAGISRDGRVVTFQSFANNLVAGDTNRRRDVFVRVLPPLCRDARRTHR
jgi:Tol biopolymer transport system component